MSELMMQYHISVDEVSKDHWMAVLTFQKSEYMLGKTPDEAVGRLVASIEEQRAKAA